MSSNVLAELSVQKSGPFIDTFYIYRGETCLGSIQWDKERGYLFHPTDYSGGLTVVELGMIRARMEDSQVHGLLDK